MCPPLIYPQLPHLHNYGLAMLACITPSRNMCPPPVYWRHLKRSFWRSDVLLKYHQNPRVLKRRSMKKKGKRKTPRVSSNKRGSRYFERRKTLQLQNSFLMWFHFLPLPHTILKTFSKIIEKVFLTLFRPSFSLAIYMTRDIPFSFTHELHIFSLSRVGWGGTFVEPRWQTTYQKSAWLSNVGEP
jgi:hypothetical protein